MASSARSSVPYLAFAALLSAAILLSACSSAAAPVAPTNTPPATTSAAPTATPAADVRPAIPVLAYYYIWFDHTTWDKNKIDYPLLGHYSSSDPAVIRQHIEWAKSAGIYGFLVSWKNTPTLNQRLDALVQIAQAEKFKLGIVYEGLDFQRNPLPASTVATDLDYFIAHYADNPVFNIYSKPLYIWAGTWKFSTADIASVAQGPGRRDKVLLLASDRDVPGVQRLTGLVDGDAYYFSSVNPDTFSNYGAKLTAMGQAVHATHGLWIAPAAPGFDARLIGGTTVVDRNNGQTLRAEMNAAWKSSPDSIGLISWNEFSENSYVEPSVKYGRQYLDILTSIDKAGMPQGSNLDLSLSVDSSDPGSGPGGFALKATALGLVAALVVTGMITIARRH